MASKKITAMPDLAGGQVPTDLMTIVDLSQPASLQNVKSTLNDAFAEITKNITDLTVQFGNGVTGTVSAAGKGKIRYNNTAGSFQVSENAGAYQNLLKGSGTATRAAFWSAADELSSNANFYWDNVNERLGIGVGSTPGAPIDVLADSGALAQQWRPNSGTPRVQMQVNSSEGIVGTSTLHRFHLMTNNLIRLTVEDTGAVGINQQVPTAQLQVIAANASAVGLKVNTAASPSVNIAEFYNDSALRFTFDPTGILTLGLAGTPGATGQLTFAVAGQANTQTLRAGTAPAATNTYLWPNADPTAGQALTASAPVAGVVTMSWTTVGTLSGSGVATRVAFWTGTSLLSSDAAYYWDNTNKRLSVGVGTSPGAPIDVLAESFSAIAQQWRPNTGTMRAAIKLDGGPETFFGTTTAHNLHFITSDIQRISIEDTSGNVGINKITAIAAQLQVVANSATTVPLILNSAPSTSVNLAEIYNDASIRYTFDNSGILTLGKAGASGATGQLTFAVNGQANTQTLRGGATPASTLTFLWPSADPTVGQVLSASAPSAGVVTLSWATASGGTPGSPTNSVQYNNAGAFGGNSGFLYTPASTTGNELALASSTITSGHLFAIALTGTGAASNTRTALNVSTSGANATSTQTTYGAQISNTSTGTSSTNIGAAIIATGANTNIAALLTGSLGQSGSASFSIYGGNSSTVIIGTGPGSASVALLGTGGVYVPSGAGLGITSSSSALNTPDIRLVRATTSVFRVSDNSTGLGSILIGASTDSLTGNFTVMSSNAATATVVTVARLGVNSTGTAANGFGPALSFSAESSTTNNQETALISSFWTTATHATRTAALSWSLTNNASLSEFMRLNAPGGAGGGVCLSVHGGAAPNIWTSGSYVAKLYLISSTLRATGVVANFSSTSADSPQWQFLRGAGTNASPTAIQNTYGMGDLEWWGQTSTSTNNVVAGARIRVSATENWSAGNNGCQMIFYTSNNASTITDRMYIKETGTVRIGATSGSYDTTTLLQVGNYGSFATGVVAAIYSGANGTKGLQVIGTNGQTANLLEIFRDSLTPNLLTLAASGVLSLRAGLNTGTTVANVGGTIHEDFTPVSNSGTAETDLMTYSLPASTMGTDNDYLDVEAWGEFTAAASNKTVKMYFGSTVIFNTTALAFGSGAWRLKATIVRGSSSSQATITVFSGDTALVTTTAQVGAPGETMSGAITIKCTGQSSAASDEVFQEGFIVKWYPASN